MVKASHKPPLIRLLLTLALGLGMATVTYNLGQWQTGRAAEKLELQKRKVAAAEAAPISPSAAQVDIQALEFRRVELTGQFLPEWTVYIDNRQFNGQPFRLFRLFNQKGRLSWCQ